jgi:hypothetical protein
LSTSVCHWKSRIPNLHLTWQFFVFVYRKLSRTDRSHSGSGSTLFTSWPGSISKAHGLMGELGLKLPWAPYSNINLFPTAHEHAFVVGVLFCKSAQSVARCSDILMFLLLLLQILSNKSNTNKLLSNWQASIIQNFHKTELKSVRTFFF